MASARRILAFDWLTADGYFAGSDGNLNWVVPDDEQAKAAAAGVPAADTVLFGRRTYELFERFWRKALETPLRRPPPPWARRGRDRGHEGAARQGHYDPGSGSCPVFLGGGRRLLDGLSKSVMLELLEATKYPSGDVALRYAPRVA